MTLKNLLQLDFEMSCETYFDTMVTILKQKKMQVQLMRMRYQNQRNT